jgi:hypothetical protein
LASCPAYPPLHPAWTEPVTRANPCRTTPGTQPAGYRAEHLSGQERGLHDGCAFGRGRFLLACRRPGGRTARRDGRCIFAPAGTQRAVTVGNTFGNGGSALCARAQSNADSR